MLYDKTAYPSWLDQNNPVADQEGYVTYSGLAFRANIQPESPMVAALGDGLIYATYRAFTTFSGLQIGWRLTVSGNASERYIVRGVERYNYGAGQHYEATLERPTQ